jgi:NhaA family Na+:H+ antiporter
VTSPRPYRLLGRGSWAETRRIADILRKETVGGVLLIAGAVLALVWANSPWAGS